MSAKAKLLYASWVIPPSHSGSSYITHHLAKYFAPEEIVVVGGSRVPFQKTICYDGVQYHYFFTELSWYGHGNRYFVIFRWLLFPIFLLNLMILVKKEKPDAILATFPDGYYLSACWLIARLFNIRLFCYYHNTYAENRKGFSKWIATQIQKRVFGDSKIIYLISEGMHDYYVKTYPEFIDKYQVLPHTFQKYPSIKKSVTWNERIPPYRFVMIGTFNESNMEATIRLLKLIAKHPLKYQVDIYTHSSKQVLKYKWGLDLDELEIHYKGFAAQDIFEQLISSYDACLLTHGFTGDYSEVEYQTIFPTRMIPLLLSGNPILVHAPEHSYLSRFVRQYDCAELVTSTSDQDLLTALEKITVDLARIRQLIVHAKTASRYFYGEEVIKILNRGLQQ